MSEPGVTMQQVFEIISKMNEQQMDNMMKFAAELRKPTEREQRKIDDEDRRLAVRQQERLKLAESEENRKKLMAAGCPHATTHPGTGVTKHTWRAQVHAPHGEKPYFVPTCQICWTQAPRILATPDMLTNGVNLDHYTGIDLDRLKKWAEQMNAAVA